MWRASARGFCYVVVVVTLRSPQLGNGGIIDSNVPVALSAPLDAVLVVAAGQVRVARMHRNLFFAEVWDFFL